MSTMTIKGKTMRSVDVDWNEFYYTNCPLISCSNVDQELGWVKEEFKKIGVAYKYLRSTTENDWYPHYVHNLDNLMRYGGCHPAIHVQADIRRTRLIGTTQVYEGGVMMVRARDPIYKMSHLKGKKIGLSKSLNVIKNDWWRVQEEHGIELMLMLNDMTRDDVEIVEFPYPDDWYDKPEMLTPMENPNEYQLKRDHKHDLAFRPLETALEKGVIDAMYSQSKVLSVLSETTGKFKSIEDLSRYPDWTLQGAANVPATLTVTDVACEQHPELIVALLKGLIKVGRWANEHRRAAAAILNKQTYYRDEEDTYEGIRRVEFVPVLSPINLQTLQINKDFMLSHGYIENDFDVFEWAAPEFLEKAAAELLEEEWKKRSMAKLPEARPLEEAMEMRLG
jgi:ABC-type nitrate/sulfonate/bicarbonate transport system substrate-binding protein